MKFLDNIPFALLMAVTGSVFAGAGVLFVNGDSSLAGLVASICALAGFFGGIVTLRKRGLGPFATMRDFAETDE